MGKKKGKSKQPKEEQKSSEPGTSEQAKQEGSSRQSELEKSIGAGKEQQKEGPPQKQRGDPQTVQSQEFRRGGGGRGTQPPQWGPHSSGQDPSSQLQQQPPQWGPRSGGQGPPSQQQQQPPQWGPRSGGQGPPQQQQQQPPQWGPRSGGQGPPSQQQQQPPKWGPRSGGQGPPPQQQQQQPPQWGPRSGGQGPPPQQQQKPPQWGPRSGGQGPQSQQQQQPPKWGPRSGGQGPPPQQQQPQQGPSSEGKGDMGKDERKMEGVSQSQPSGDKKSSKVVPYEFTPRIWAKKKSGRPIKISTNFFPLKIGNPNIVVCHYDVIIEPDKPKYLIRSVWNKYMELVFPNRLAAFDGKNAYTRGPLEKWESSAANITIFNEENQKEKEFKVSINEVRRVTFDCFHNYRTKIFQDRSFKALPEAELSVLEIILRNWACDKFIRSDRTFFPPSSSSPPGRDLSRKLSLQFGYFQSCFLGYSLYLNFDLAHKAFYKSLPVLEVLNCFSRQGRNVDIDSFNHFIRTVKVGYQLPNNQYRVFRINKLVGNANTQKFKKEDGKEITVAQYFLTEKNIQLKHPDLPLLWVGPTQRTIYIPMEFCTILPDQTYKGFVDPFETREMVKLATSNARQRQKDVYALFRDVNINSHPLMKEFELEVSNEMEKVEAHVLNPPDLKTSRNVRVKDGVWRIQDFFEPVTLDKWCILILDRQVSKQGVMNLQRLIKDKGSDLNMRVADPAKNPIEADPSVTGIKKAFMQLKGMKLVFVIISEAKGIYSKVKAICETQEGILTQCVKSRTVSQDTRKLMTTVENILLKVNAKLGGINHCLDKASVPGCLSGYTMVVGADVTHASPGMNIPSVAAVTVSCDPSAFQYGTTTRVQPKGEIIKDLEEIMSIHVKKFHDIRRAYPEKIIFFRDGVSEGEMEKVLRSELTAVKKACSPYCQPKITFVIVQKRHHARFFPVNPADEQGKNFNVPVGTCVDTEIVNPRELEFYLVSHASILGTARPTRYRLLHDDNKLTDDEVETLAFYLCHLFSRCNRSVSYPSPTYNAHLAAARVRAYLEGLNLMGGTNIDDIKRNMPDRISSISPMFFV